MNRSRVGSLLARLAAPLALALFCAVALAFASDRAAAVARGFAAATAVGVLVLLALGAGRARSVVALAALAAAPAVALLPAGRPLQLAAVSWLLLSAVAAVAALRSPARSASLFDWVLLAGAAQAVVWGRLTWSGEAPATAVLLLLAVPIAAGAALAALAASRPGAAAPLGCAAVAAGPGLAAVGCAVLGIAALVAFALRERPASWRWWLPPLAAAPALVCGSYWLAVVAALLAGLASAASVPGIAAAARTGFAALAYLGLLAAAPPWVSERPLPRWLAGLGEGSFTTSQTLLSEPGALLTRSSPRLGWEIPSRRVARVVVDSFGAGIADLPCGTPLARVRWLASGTEVYGATLVAGDGSGDWAARRPDVARRLACAPRPWVIWVPAGERFFGSTYRTVLRPPTELAADRLVIERASTLPAAAQLFLAGVEVEP